MAVDYSVALVNTNGVAFPLTEAVNSTGAGLFDGTEFVKLLVDDLWGFNQALLREAGITPSGSSETATTSQRLEAIRFMVQNSAVNAYYDGAWKYIANGTASRWYVDDVNGRVQFLRAASGVAGGAITWFDALSAEWRVDTFAGYGSTDTMIPYFSNVRVNTDPAGDFTIVNDATNGCSITINNDGVYDIGFSIQGPNGTDSQIGISLNSSQLTTSAGNINVQDRLQYSRSGGGAGTIQGSPVNYSGKFVATDVIRPHADAGVPGVTSRCHFYIKRIL